MAKQNYSFEKRQRELQKKKRKEEKNQRKLARGPMRATETVERSSDAPTPAETDMSAENV